MAARIYPPLAVALFLSIASPTCAAAAVPVPVAVNGAAAVHIVDDLFVSFTMDTGDIASGYAGMDMESPEVLALVRAVGPAYVRLSGGVADSLGYNETTTAPAASGELKAAGAGAPAGAPAGVLPHCVPYKGDNDCGNCDAANTAQGPPAAALGSASQWFNRSTWDRVNRFAAAVDFRIIFGLNSKARAATDTPWDGRFGMATLINYTASQDPLKFPVAGFGACWPHICLHTGLHTWGPPRISVEMSAFSMERTVLPTERFHRNPQYPPH